jgi:hypothetical protein
VSISTPADLMNDALIDAAAAAAWETDGFPKWWPDGFHSAPAASQERYCRLATVVLDVFSRASEESQPDAARGEPQEGDAE